VLWFTLTFSIIDPRWRVQFLIVLSSKHKKQSTMHKIVISCSLIDVVRYSSKRIRAQM